MAPLLDRLAKIEANAVASVRAALLNKGFVYWTQHSEYTTPEPALCYKKNIATFCLIYY